MKKNGQCLNIWRTLLLRTAKRITTRDCGEGLLYDIRNTFLAELEVASVAAIYVHIYEPT